MYLCFHTYKQVFKLQLIECGIKGNKKKQNKRYKSKHKNKRKMKELRIKTKIKQNKNC